MLGLSSETAAHRIAVERDTPDGVEPSVSACSDLSGAHFFATVSHQTNDSTSSSVAPCSSTKAASAPESTCT